MYQQLLLQSHNVSSNTAQKHNTY